MPAEKGMVLRASVSPDQRRILTACATTVAIRDAKTLGVELKVDLRDQYASSPTLSPDNRLLAVVNESETVTFGYDDGETGIQGSGTKTSWGLFSGSTISLWNADTGKLLYMLFGHTGDIKSLSFSPNNRFLVSGSEDGTARIWNTETGREVLQLVDFQNGEWIAVTPQGYYVASVNGDAALTVRNGNKVSGIENYRSTFYKPKVVEAALRLRDGELAVSEVLGCKDQCTTLADLPDMEPPVVVVRYPEDGDTLRAIDTTLAVHIEDRRNLVNSVSVFVNGRPIRGKTIRPGESTRLEIPRGQQTLDLKIPLRLDKGENLITVTALGKSEAVNNLRVFVLTEDLANRTEIDTIWILAIGVNKYKDKNLRSLTCPSTTRRE